MPTTRAPTCSSIRPTSCTKACSTAVPACSPSARCWRRRFSPAWGVYSGYELFEHRPVREGSEEYLDSEKYELRPARLRGRLGEGESLEPFLGRLNEIRRLHPALREMRTLKFHHVDNDALLAYSKFDPMTGDAVLVVVTLNPFGTEEATTVAGHGRAGDGALRPLLGARRDQRRRIPMGTVELRSPRSGQGGRPRFQHAADPTGTTTDPASQGMRK